MAMAAGLLGRRLDKPGAYVLGASFEPPSLADIDRAARLVRLAGVLAFVLAVASVAGASASCVVPTSFRGVAVHD